MNASAAQDLHQQVAAYVEHRTGLSFTGSQGRRFRQAVTRTLPDVPTRAPRGAEPLTEEAFSSLCEALTVQESYFFREPAKLALVRKYLLPGLAARRAPLRVWSAGCAAGEEAYTLAALLTEAGFAGRYRVLGTDLSEDAVAAARRGSYTRWSVRGLGEESLTRIFEMHDSRYRVVDRYRENVSFEQHNLLDSRPHGWGPFELVLCRNVLIYFTPEAARAVVEGLRDSLAPGGWLVLGVSDPLADDVPGLETVVTEHGLAYRRVDLESPVETAAAETMRQTPPSRVGHRRPTADRPGRRQGLSRPVRPPSAPQPEAVPDHEEVLAAAVESLGLAHPAEAERLARKVLTASPGEREAHLVLVQALAEQARAREAVTVAERAVGLFPEDGEVRHFLAVALLERGDAAGAAAAARQAVYLDPTLASAHLVLARAQELLGDAGVARRSRRNGRRLLTEMVDP